MDSEKKFKDFIYKISTNIYHQLGTGHSESIYQKALQAELKCQGFRVDMEYHLSVEYKDTKGNTHSLASERIDIFIHQDNDSLLDNNRAPIILELKATTKIPAASEIEQVRKYLREFKKKEVYIPYGIVVNFPQPNNTGVSDVIHCLLVKLE
jgi:GxxExxY protein